MHLIIVYGRKIINIKLNINYHIDFKILKLYNNLPIVIGYLNIYDKKHNFIKT